MIGTTIGNYTITARLGAGGMGEVYRARDNRLGRDVAVKVLPDAFAADPERLARFEREARLLAGLNHPNIGAIYGLEEHEGHRYLVLELVEGENLAQRLERGPLAVDDVIDIVLQVAEALESAHEHGVVHRDLKPANIQMTGDGRVKVLDFGLAKALDASSDSSPDLSQSPTIMASSPTMAGVILGTAAYMSPEQARGRHVDKRADIFAFGAVVMELLTGRAVFAGETVSDTLAAVLRADPDFDKLPANTPRALRRLLARCLEKDPRRRLRDIGEARIVIEDIRSGSADQKTAATPAARRPIARDVVPWALVLVIAVVAVWRMQSVPAPSTSEQPPRPVRKMTFESERTAVRCDPVLSPDGHYIVFPLENQLWLRDLSAVDPKPLAGTVGAYKPCWSPDGEWIIFVQDNRLMRMRRDGSSLSLVATLPSEARMVASGSLVWTHDDRIIIGTGTSGLHVVPARGGTVEQLLAPREDETDFHEICGLPDDRGWVVVPHTTGGIGNLDVVLPDLTRKPILRIAESLSAPVYAVSGHILFLRRGITAGIWAFPFSVETLERTGEPFLVAADGAQPSTASDGTLSYVIGGGQPIAQPAILDRSGNVLSVLGEPTTTFRPFPVISPDGSQFLCAADVADGREVFLYDMKRGTRRRLTFNDEREDIASWKRNGRDIFYYESNAFGTYTMSIDGTAETQKLVDGIMVAFTPDETEIVFARHRTAIWDFDLYVAKSDGSDEKPFIARDGSEWAPAFSPDGKYLAYNSVETGRWEVFVVPYPDQHTRWQVSTDGGMWPKWRADGKELFFTTRTEMWAVDVNSDRGLTLGEPRKLFDRPTVNWSSSWTDGFDVTVDGQRFVMWKPLEDENVAPVVVVVQNWFEEFK